MSALSSVSNLPSVRPLNIVISGKGPAGLACALEAIAMGHRPILLEKRSADHEGRIQPVNLIKRVVDQLERFSIYSDLLKQNLVFPMSPNRCTVRLGDLEKRMKVALERIGGKHVPIHYEKTISKIVKNGQKVDLVLSNGEVLKQVDVVVNAEGFHSSTNQLLSNGRVEVLREIQVVTSILSDDRPKIDGVGACVEYVAKTMRNIALSIYHHVIYFFLLVFTGEHFLSSSKNIAFAATLKTPGQHQVSLVFGRDKEKQLEKMQEDIKAGKASQQQLDNMLQFWIRMAQCEVNVISILAKIGALFGYKEDRLVASSHLPIEKAFCIKVRSDRAEQAALVKGSSLILVAGDALSTVDPSTGLGCNAGIETATYVAKALEKYSKFENLQDIAKYYTDNSRVLVDQNHKMAMEIRGQFAPYTLASGS